MWEGTDLFEVDPTAGLNIDLSTGDVSGAGSSLGFSLNPDTGDVTGGGGPVGVGAGAPTSAATDSWLATLKSYGGTALDAYKTYAGFQAKRAEIDANVASVKAANDAAAQRLKLNSDLLGFSNQAERARAQASAVRAQRDAASVIAGGSSLPLWLVLALAGGFFLLKR